MIDRDASLRRAEKLLRQGRLDGAIEEYENLIQDQPNDWSTRNALGDLYVRAGRVEQAAAQFTHIADHFAKEGFFSRAIALYRKIVKIKPDDEHALLQSAEVAARQGLIVDAKACLGAIAEQRRGRGDRQGASEILLRIEALDPADFTARMEAARAAAESGGAAAAVLRYRKLASDLFARDRAPEGIEALAEVVRLDASDGAARDWLVRACLEQGQIEAAARHATTAAHLVAVADAWLAAGREDAARLTLVDALSQNPGDAALRARTTRMLIAAGDNARAAEMLGPEHVGADPDLLLLCAEVKLRAGDLEGGRGVLATLAQQQAGQSENLVLLGCSLADVNPDAAFQCIEVAAETAVAQGDYAASAAALQEFLRRAPSHIPALIRLVDISVDGDLEDTVVVAQSQLADCYLANGRAAEARAIAEDLALRSPDDEASIGRFRRALEMLGESNPDAIIADRLSGAMALPPDDLNAPLEPEPPRGVIEEPGQAGEMEQAEQAGDIPDVEREAAHSRESEELESATDAGDDGPVDSFEVVEIDLSSALTDLKPSTVAPPAAAPPRPEPAANLDEVFGEFRDEVAREQASSSAGQQYKIALTYLEMGMLDECVKALGVAVRAPRYRFEAASLLGRIERRRHRTREAIEWFERAAETPATTLEAGRALLYELGQTLEDAREGPRALAVYLELQADAGVYRDVAARIARLSRA